MKARDKTRWAHVGGGTNCQTHGIHSRDVEPCSSFGKPLSKSERIRDLECVHDPQIGRERILSGQGDVHDFLGKKADRAL